MKIDQTLIGSKIGPFTESRLAGSAGESLSGGPEKEGAEGVIVKVSREASTDAGRLRAPEPTAEGIFGVLATPQVYVPSGSVRVTEATGTAPSLRTSGLVATAQTQEREGRGLYNTGNNPERLSPTSLFVRQGTPEREARPVRGETNFDASISGVDLNRSLAERPAQTLLNEGSGAPFGNTGSLPRQLGPNPTTGDSFGIMPTSTGDATSFRQESLQPGATGPSGPLGGVNIETEPPPGGGLIDPPRQEEPEASRLGSFAPNSLVSEIGIPGNEEQDESPSGVDTTSRTADDADNSSSRGIELSQAEEEVVRQLQNRDREVREHEQAHVAAAGGLAGSPTYSYTSGPDNRQYAVGGEVSIDVSEGGSPEETIEKARTIQRAALAPADPSGQDRAVAAAAARMELNALQEMRDQSIEEAQARTGAVEADQTEVVAEAEAVEINEGPPVLATPLDAVVSGTQPTPERVSFDDPRAPGGVEQSGGTLPQQESTSRQATEAIRPNMTTEVFQELRVAREAVESREVTAGAASRGMSDYQRSENAFQGQDDYISVA